jgi:hypothetical protein
MSTTTQLADRMVEDHWGLSTTQGSTTAPRAKAVRHIQQGVNYVWMFRDWAWAYDVEDVTVGIGEDIALANYQLNLGKLGGIYYDSALREPPLDWVDPHRMLILRLQHAQSGKPSMYTLYGQGAAEDKNILLYPSNDASRTFWISYRLTPPTCVDDGGTADFIYEIPQPWRDLVVYEWALYFAMKTDANIQARTEQLTLAQGVLAQMAREERIGREAPHNLTPYMVRRGGRRRLR